MVKPFAEAVFKKAPFNKVYGPVKSDFGYHLVWVKERTKAGVSFSNRKNQIRYNMKKDKAQKEVQKIKTEVEKRTKSSSPADLEDYLKTNHFKFFESKAFDRKSRVEGIPFIVLQSALKAPLKKWEGPMDMLNHLYVYRVNEILTAEQMSLKEATPELRKRIEKDETEKLAKGLAEDLKLGKIKWASLKAKGAKVKNHKKISPYQLNEVPDLGPSEILIRAVQELTPTESYSSALIHQNKWILLHGTKFNNQPKTLPEKEQKRVKASLFSQKKGQILDSFVQRLVKEAKIPKSFRDKYKLDGHLN